MRVRAVEAAAWAGAIALGALTAARSRLPRDEAMGESTPARTEQPAAAMGDVDAAAQTLISMDPFRAGRRPSPIAYSPTIEGAPPPTQGTPRPSLGVSGIIGGPPWSAVLEGVPGREGGTVVRSGDTLSGLTVRSVDRERVVISGMDTTWRLIVRRPW